MGSTTQISVYLQGLLGPRAHARRAAIRHAQEVIAKQRGDGATSISSGSLCAISLDSIPDSMTPASQPSGAPAAEPSASNPFASSHAAKHRAAWAFGLLGATGLVVALYLAVKNAPMVSSTATATPPAAVAAASALLGSQPSRRKSVY